MRQPCAQKQLGIVRTVAVVVLVVEARRAAFFLGVPAKDTRAHTGAVMAAYIADAWATEVRTRHASRPQTGSAA